MWQDVGFLCFKVCAIYGYHEAVEDLRVIQGHFYGTALPYYTLRALPASHKAEDIVCGIRRPLII